MVKQPQDYPWSSYHANALVKEDSLLLRMKYIKCSEKMLRSDAEIIERYLNIISMKNS
jgi:hypothetical protein